MQYLHSIKILLISGFLFTCVCGSNIRAEENNTHQVQDLAYGTSLFNFFQEKYFSAITELLIAEHYQRIKSNDKNPDLLLGGLYLSYDLHDQSSKIFRQLLIPDITDNKPDISDNTDDFDDEDEADDTYDADNYKPIIPAGVEDQARFLLGKNYYHGKLYAQAEELFISIKDSLTLDNEEEKLFLLNAIFLRNKNFEQALNTLDYFSADSIWMIYAQFNTASYLVQEQDEDTIEQGIELLDDLAAIDSTNTEKRIIRDKANLALAYVALRDGRSAQSIKYFNKIRIKGIEANKALLGIGWARYREKEFKQAVIPWMHLASSQTEADLAVQEAYISIPYVFEKMQDKQQALHQYGLAIERYKFQLAETRQLVAFIKTPQFLQQLKPGSLGNESTSAASVIKNLDPLLTQYMLPLLSSREFQLAAKSYQEIIHLRYMLNHWQNNIPALQMILNEKRKTYKNKLSRTMDDDSLQKVKLLTNKRQLLVTQIRQIENKNASMRLATDDEIEKINLLTQTRKRLQTLKGSNEDIGESRNRYRFVNGRLLWEIDTDYPVRLWAVKRQLQQLKKAANDMHQTMRSLKAAWNTAPADFSRFDARIANKETQIKSLKKKISKAIGAQEQQLRMMALEELRLHRNQIKLYHDRALYAKARLYDSLMARE